MYSRMDMMVLMLLKLRKGQGSRCFAFSRWFVLDDPWFTNAGNHVLMMEYNAGMYSESIAVDLLRTSLMQRSFGRNRKNLLPLPARLPADLFTKSLKSRSPFWFSPDVQVYLCNEVFISLFHVPVGHDIVSVLSGRPSRFIQPIEPRVLLSPKRLVPRVVPKFAKNGGPMIYLQDWMGAFGSHRECVTEDFCGSHSCY